MCYTSFLITSGWFHPKPVETTYGAILRFVTDRLSGVQRTATPFVATSKEVGKASYDLSVWTLAGCNIVLSCCGRLALAAHRHRTDLSIFGGVVLTGYIYSRLNRRDDDEQIWRTIAGTEDDLGDPLVVNPIDPEIIAYGNDRETAEENNIYSSLAWQTQLANFFDSIGFLPALVWKWRSRLRVKRGKRRAAIDMLNFRDLIFQVRSDVYTKVSREAVRDHNERNRLVVARHVEESMATLNIGSTTRAKIREACINACFIDTMYDSAGQAILLGPERRPV